MSSSQQLQAANVTALALPGAAPAQALAPAGGLEALEPRFLAILTSAGVPEATMKKLGTDGFDSVAIFGNVASTREKMETFLKDVVGVDPSMRPADYLLLSKMLTAWDACRTRQEVEMKHNAERAISQLAPQISTADYELAIQAFERMEGYEPGKYPRYWIPSQPFWERLVGQTENFFEMTPLTRVTSKGQEDTNQSEFGGVDTATGLFKVKKQEFAVAYPTCPESLRNRIKVLAVAWMMVQARFPSNPKLATASLMMFQRYVEYLIGSRVWGMVSVGLDNKPISSPCCDHVLAYDAGMRKYAADCMNAGWDIKTAFEKALADAETRQLHFTTPVAIDAGTKKCTDLTAPGLAERFPSLPINSPQSPRAPRGQKRGGDVLPPPTPSPKARTQAQKRKEQKQKLKAENERLTAQLKSAQKAANSGVPRGKGRGGGGGGRGGGGGGGSAGGATPKGAGKANLPAGAKSKTGDNRMICFNWNLGQPCKAGPSCTMAHVCWFCEDTTHPGKDHP